MEKDENIRDWRMRIDVIDEILVDLLNRRAAFALEIGRLKKRYGLPIHMPEREEEILEHVQRVNKGPLTDDMVKRLFERILDESRRLEREYASHGGGEQW
ncbi:MAG: chorismate mutase [Candidatus Latescibacterota bacterium]|nr:MAG: chorismate mutase [Candidatus Latescibacterota bacterium]